MCCGVEQDISKSLESRTMAATTTAHGGGTALYMAPELGKGQSASAASDVYAVGVVLALSLLEHAPRQAR